MARISVFGLVGWVGHGGGFLAIGWVLGISFCFCVGGFLLVDFCLICV